MRKVGYLLFSLTFLLIGINAEAQSDTAAVSVTDIVYVGLKKTKSFILEREVTVKVGESYKIDFLKQEAEQSKSNIFNTGLFNTVKVDIIPLEGKSVMLIFEVTERFYTYPIPVFKFEEPNLSTWFKNGEWDRTSYGMMLVQKNVRGRDETLVLEVQAGFTKRYGIIYDVPYINKSRTLGARFNFFYSLNKDVPYQTYDNERIFYDDISDVRQEYDANIKLTYRPKTYGSLRWGAYYKELIINDSLSALNPEYIISDNNTSKFFQLRLGYKWSKTDNRGYPLLGSTYEVKANQYGLGIVSNQVNLFTLEGEIKKYWQLRPKLWFQTGVWGKYSLYDEMPYSLQEGLGYGDNYVRGFEFYVIDAQHYVYSRNNIRIPLLRNKEFNVPIIKMEQFKKLPYAFYFNVYADVGYAVDDLYRFSSVANQTLFGSGVGIDLITAYDRAMRFEYSFNNQGENGFYIAYSKSI